MNSPAKNDLKVLRAVDREVLRDAFVSLFWGVIEKRQREGDFKMADLAAACGKDKTAVSHWFSDELPNWTENTIADIARGLDVELIIKARDRKDGTIITPYGVENQPLATTVWRMNMTIEEATAYLGATVKGDRLYDLAWLVMFTNGEEFATLDGQFDADDLLALSVYVRAHGIPTERSA